MNSEQWKAVCVHIKTNISYALPVLLPSCKNTLAVFIITGVTLYEGEGLVHQSKQT